MQKFQFSKIIREISSSSVTNTNLAITDFRCFKNFIAILLEMSSSMLLLPLLLMVIADVVHGETSKRICDAACDENCKRITCKNMFV